MVSGIFRRKKISLSHKKASKRVLNGVQSKFEAT
jgi:hypothetical protein